MVMELLTATQVINFAIEIEERLATFYEGLSRKFPQAKETFLSFAEESRKSKLRIQRSYYEAVSDALETGFSFEGLNVEESLIEEHLGKDNSCCVVLEEAVVIEEKIQRFYREVASTSKPFLADILRTFERIAKRRTGREKKLRSLYDRLILG